MCVQEEMDWESVVGDTSAALIDVREAQELKRVRGGLGWRRQGGLRGKQVASICPGCGAVGWVHL